MADPNESMESRLERYEDALRTIVNHEGKVCDEFEICTHRGCNSSCSSWMIADDALKGER